MTLDEITLVKKELYRIIQEKYTENDEKNHKVFSKALLFILDYCYSEA